MEDDRNLNNGYYNGETNGYNMGMEETYNAYSQGMEEPYNQLNNTERISNYKANDAVMSYKDWLITFLILFIPFVNVAMIFVWALGNGNTTRKNYFRAILIIFVVISILMVFLFLSALL